LIFDFRFQAPRGPATNLQAVAGNRKAQIENQKSEVHRPPTLRQAPGGRKSPMRSVAPHTIGLTATVPVEILLAAGLDPLDLNNVFITSPDPASLLAEAEHRGFPLNCCAWIKGLYATVRRLGIRRVIGVAQGDCSNTHALMDVLASEGVEVIRFNYPYPKNAAALESALEDLAGRLGTTLEAAERERRRLEPLRRTLAEIDRLSWQDGRVTGEENHRWLIGSSDFGGDPAAYAREAEAFLAEARQRPPRNVRHRVGYVGIPPIAAGLYEFLDGLGAGVVFNEFQRQFSMPPAESVSAEKVSGTFSERPKKVPDTFSAAPENLVGQYLAYTYPYDIEGRIEDIRRAVAERRLDGLVHYVQSFCFRHLQDRLLREAMEIPILTLEFDRPARLDGQARTRLEAFVEMLDARA
jgi:benzoyl-CoA reductase/2-hydroxyglutaryl-CoA dehydratase subunit BcrC/BadD/HgdB